MSIRRVSAIEIYKRTGKSNCGECGLDSCMAFSAFVSAGKKDPEECRHLSEKFKQEIRQVAEKTRNWISDQTEARINPIRNRMREIDFKRVAYKLGGEVQGERLVLHCLGRIFQLDHEGRMYSQCHINSKIHIPLLMYVVLSKGLDPRGEWVTFNEIKSYRSWNLLFNHRCLAVMRQVADRNPELFLDIIEIFSDRFKTQGFKSDHSMVLYPFPKVPVLIRYYPREDIFESSLSLLFDRTIEANLPAEGTYILCVGLVEMIDRIAQRHGMESGLL